MSAAGLFRQVGNITQISYKERINMIKTLKKNGAYRLMQYDNDYYSVDFSNESVGYTILFSKDKEQVINKYDEVTMTEKHI